MKPDSCLRTICLDTPPRGRAEGGRGEGARPNKRGDQVGTGLEDGEAAALSRENLGSHLGEALSSASVLPTAVLHVASAPLGSCNPFVCAPRVQAHFFSLQLAPLLKQLPAHRSWRRCCLAAREASLAEDTWTRTWRTRRRAGIRCYSDALRRSNKWHLRGKKVALVRTPPPLDRLLEHHGRHSIRQIYQRTRARSGT